MPQVRLGNMWTAYAAADLFLVSTNSTIRQDGALVMGRGIARQAKERFPGLDVALGRHIQAFCGNQGVYGLLISPRWPTAKWCIKHPTATVAVNFPGIGNGRLHREAVLPIIVQLPAQVTIWEYPQSGKENTR